MHDHLRFYFVWFFMTGLIGSIIFANEKKFLITPGGLELAQEVQAYLNSQDQNKKNFIFREILNRPPKCPLKSIDKWGTIQKLQAITIGLKNGQCGRRYTELIDGFSTMVTQINNAVLIRQGIRQGLFNNYQGTLLGPSVNPIDDYVATVRNANAATTTTTVNSVDLATRAKTIMNNLTQASQDEDCLNDFKDKDLIATVAEIALSMGQVAMIVPSPNGLLIGASSLAFGSTIAVIKSLFASPFEWELEKDRSHFLALNCSFYDLRHELEASDFFRIKDSQISKKIAFGKSLETTLSQLLKKVLEQRAAFIRHTQEQQKNFHQHQLGEKTYHFTQEIARIYPMVSGLDFATFNTKKQLDFLLVMIPSQQTLVKNFSVDKNFPYNSVLFTLLQEFSQDKLSQLSQLDFKAFHHTYVDPIRVYLQNALMYLQKKQDEATVLFLHLKDDEKQIANEHIINETEKRFLKIEQDIQKYLSATQRRLATLSISSLQNSYNSYDDGAQVKYNILAEYQNIQDIIFGPLGWSFLSHLMNETQDHLEDFHRGFRRWMKKYTDLNSESQRKWACRDANNLRILWDQSSSAMELLEDFYQTNKGIFTTNVKRFSWFLNILPYKYSHGRKIYLNMMTAEKAKAYIAHDRSITLGEIKKHRPWPHRNLGLLYLKVEENQASRRQIENFMDTKECLQYL